MNAREALEYLERVVEDRADIDPGIHRVIEILSEAVDRERELEKALRALVEWCEVGETMPVGAFIESYNKAARLIYKKDQNVSEIS